MPEEAGPDGVVDVPDDVYDDDRFEERAFARALTERRCQACGRPLDEPDAPGDPCDACGAPGGQP